jgi:hypothetical protein
VGGAGGNPGTSADPTYSDDFWTVPRHLGADGDSRVVSRLVDAKATVRAELTMADVAELDPRVRLAALGVGTAASDGSDAVGGIVLGGVDGAPLATSTTTWCGRRSRARSTGSLRATR